MPEELHLAQHDPSSLAAAGFLSRDRESTVSAYRNDLRCLGRGLVLESRRSGHGLALVLRTCAERAGRVLYLGTVGRRRIECPPPPVVVVG